MKFWVVNLGCKVNRVESDSFAAELLSRGHELSNSFDVDLVVVNTCTVTGEAEKKTRKAVRNACASYKEALVVVTGCAAAIDPSTYRDMSDRVLTLPKHDLLRAVQSRAIQEIDDLSDALSARFYRLVQAPDVCGDSLEVGVLSSAEIRASSTFNTRVGIKVQDGCDNECTYCIVHTARGRACSRPVREILDEVEALLRAGVKEIVLSGINLGSYGKQVECQSGIQLARLLEMLLEIADKYSDDVGNTARFRVSSVEPCDIDDEFIRVLSASNGRICRHLHLPMQSGNSKVLHEMNRPYAAEDYANIVAKLRNAVPGLSLSTDVIAGFPGESESEFLDTLNMCKQCGFSKIHVFPYSRRAGTPAAERLDQISPEVKADRASRLRALAQSLRRSDYQKRIGSVEAVLVESNGRGLTESYYEVRVPSSIPRGSLISMTLPQDFAQ